MYSYYKIPSCKEIVELLFSIFVHSIFVQKRQNVSEDILSPFDYVL